MESVSERDRPGISGTTSGSRNGRSAGEGKALSVTQLRLLLVVISIGSGIAMVIFGAIARIEYDGWWHVFIARVSDWPMFWREVYTNAHPPIFFLLLKFASACLGYSRLAYRAVSIVSGVFSVFLVGLIAARVCRSQITVVLATLTFAASTVTIVMANEVRSYMLAGAFCLVSLYFLIDVIETSSNRIRSRILCSLGLTLGVLSHYVVFFVLPIILVLPLVLVVAMPDYRQRVLGVWKKSLAAHLIMMSVPIAVAAEEYVFHISRFHGSTVFSYLSRFFFQPGERLSSYIWRVLLDELGLFTPIDLNRTTIVMQVLAVAVVLAGAAALFRNLRRNGQVGEAVIPVVAVLLVGELLAASIIGRYPFGGPLRHQYLVFPVALISFFLWFDRSARRIPSHAGRVAVQVGLLSVLVLSGVFQWGHLKIPHKELATEGVRKFRTEFSDATNIYLDQFSLILFFAHSHDADWVSDSSFHQQRTDRFRVEKGDRVFDVYRDRRWQAHMDDPGVYKNLRRTLKKSALDRIVVFHLERIPRGEIQGRRKTREGAPQRLKKFASRNELELTRVVRQRRSIFAEFELVD